MENSALSHPVARLRQPEGGEYLLYSGRPVRLGRSGENDIVINDPKVSRFHAVLDWVSGGFAIRDLNSVNGTRVNHEAVLGSMVRTLHDGDEIRIHQRLLIYEIVRVDSSEPVTEPHSVGSTGNLRRRGPFLTVEAGPDQGGEFPLWGEQLTIGRLSRETNIEIRLSDETVSRPHARLDLHDEGYFLSDLESNNGTRLNGEKICAPCLLQNGDRIEVGRTCLVFHHQK